MTYQAKTQLCIVYFHPKTGKAAVYSTAYDDPSAEEAKRNCIDLYGPEAEPTTVEGLSHEWRKSDKRFK